MFKIKNQHVRRPSKIRSLLALVVLKVWPHETEAGVQSLHSLQGPLLSQIGNKYVLYRNDMESEGYV